ncbi:MAG: winged helix-turn-helix domain-containing protein [Pyrinomonadaceae bacterium]
MTRRNGNVYEFAGFRLNAGEKQLLRDGEPVPLTLKAFDLLVVLVENSGHLLGKSELLDRVWPDSFVEEANLSVKMSELRRALGEGPNERHFIETVPRRGYRFVADVTEAGNGVADTETLASIPPASIGPEAESSQIAPEDRYTIRRLWPVYLVGVAVVSAVLFWLNLGGVRDRYFGSTNASPTASEGPVVASNTGDSGLQSPAYDLYVRAKVKLGSENREDAEAAIKLLEEAVRVDPDFAAAYAQLARGYNTLAFKYSSTTERKRFHESAEVAIEKALALDPNLAEAHFARGLILWSSSEAFPHLQVIKAYKRSAEIEPNWDEPYHQLSLVYSHIGLMDEARQSVQKALEINPNNTLARFRVGVYLEYSGKFEEALAVFKTIPRDETPLLMDRSLAETLIQVGRLNEAAAIADDYLRRFPQDDGGGFTGVKALILAKEGKHDEAESMIQRAIEIGRGFGHFHHTAHNIASAYAAMKRPDEAVKWLEYAADSGFPNYPYFEIDPNLQNLKEDPGFLDFMARLRKRWEQFKAEAQ